MAEGKQVTEQVRKGVYLAARMTSDFDVTTEDYARKFDSINVDPEDESRFHLSSACACFCVDGRVCDPFNMSRNISVVGRNIAGQMAGTSTLQFAYEDMEVNLAMSAGHEDCGGIHLAIEELERLEDQMDGRTELVRERISNCYEEIDSDIHPKEKHIYNLLRGGGIDIYREARASGDVEQVDDAMAEEWARQQVFHTLRIDPVRHLVECGRLVLSSSMIRFPEVGQQRTDLTMVVHGGGDGITIRRGSEIIEAFPDIVTKAFTGEDGMVDREQMDERCVASWATDIKPDHAPELETHGDSSDR